MALGQKAEGRRQEDFESFTFIYIPSLICAYLLTCKTFTIQNPNRMTSLVGGSKEERVGRKPGSVLHNSICYWEGSYLSGTPVTRRL